MAQLEVQPKRSTNWWLWVFFTIIVLAALFYFIRSRGRDASDPNLNSGTSAVIRNASRSTTDAYSVDFDSPLISTYTEISDPDIQVRGTDNYAIYSMNETVLFDSEKSEVKAQASAKLAQIAGSASKRFKDGTIVVMGYADASGSSDYNKSLSANRAEAVKQWFVKNGGIPISKITVQSYGENQPAASNGTQEGRAENRRVEIVVKGNQ